DKCPVCGFVLSTSATAPPSRVACIACGELIPAGSTECPSCGAPQTRAPGPNRTASEDDAPPLLKDSSSYLVEESVPDEAYRLFGMAQRAGKGGVVIARTFAQKGRERLSGPPFAILWLSTGGQDA